MTGQKKSNIANSVGSHKNTFALLTKEYKIQPPVNLKMRYAELACAIATQERVVVRGSNASRLHFASDRREPTTTEGKLVSERFLPRLNHFDD